MEDLAIVFGYNHLSNQSERDKTFKQVHQLYMLKRRQVQLNNNYEVIRDEMAGREESDTFYDDSEELRNDMQTNKSEESVTSKIMPEKAMENVKCKIID